MKQCSKCKQLKDNSEFSKDKYRTDGLCCQCKHCHGKYHREYDKKYYKEHREECSVRMKKYYNTHQEELKAEAKIYREEHLDECLARSRKYYNRHREEGIFRLKRWYEAHREESIVSTKEWQEENPERRKEIFAKCYARRKRNLDWILLYPNPFDETEKTHKHHITDKHVVYLPEDLHQLYYCGRNTEQHRENLSYIIDQIYGGGKYGY